MSIINYLRLSRTDSDELSVITAKQGDNLGDVCKIEVYDNQTIVDLSSFDDIVFYANKPDKSSILFRISDGKSNFTKNNNTLNLTLTDVLLAVHGTVKCEISFYKGQEIKSTYDFNIYVFKSPGSYDNLNVSDLSTIKNAVQKVEEAKSSAKESAKNAKQSELNAKASEIASANSASSALSSANTATSKANEAKVSADNASKSETNSANSATLSESWAIGGTNSRSGEDTNNAQYYSNQAYSSAIKAKTSETNASSSAIASANSASESKTYRDTTETYKNDASTSATSASVSENNAKTSEQNAKISETNASASASTATIQATKSANSASNALSSANSAKASEEKAKTSEDNAKTYANNASNSATSSSNSAKLSESFAHGNGTRENDNIDNAQYYYLQAKSISEDLSGALRPIGTVTFANLPSLTSVSEGDMYNISDEFTTTTDFKEGSGFTIPAGSNVYRTADGKWDILAGSPVTGVKGNAESAYRKGNVNITPSNIGAVATNGDVSNTTATFSESSTRGNISTGEKLSTILGKIKKWFSELKAVAFSGSYNDLSNKPTIPSVGNGTITITQNGTTKGTFTTNQSGNTTIKLTDNNTTYGVATSSALGLVKSGTDITVDSSGNVSVNDDSHNHVISNVDGLQSALDGKSSTNHAHTVVNGVTPEWSGQIKFADTDWLCAWTSDGTKIKALHKNSFATASHTHSYLPLSGGTLTGYLFFSQSSRKCDIGFSGGGDNTFMFVNQQNSSGGGFHFRSYDGIGVLSKDGSSWKSVTASSFNNASSIKFKDNVQDITEERAKELLKYRVVTYDYKNKDNGTNCMGLIAEEVAEIESYPVQMKDNEIFGLDYSRFVPQLIKMVQMQQEEIEELKEKIS